MPQTKEAIISYLSSDLFKGVGKKTAQNIVNTLGDNAINDILDDHSVLEKFLDYLKRNRNKLQNKFQQIKNLKK